MYTIFNMLYFEVFGITQDLDFRMSLSVDQCIFIIMQMETYLLASMFFPVSIIDHISAATC